MYLTRQHWQEKTPVRHEEEHLRGFWLKKEHQFTLASAIINTFPYTV